MESSIDPGRIQRSAHLRWKDEIIVVPPSARISLHTLNDIPMLVKVGDDALRQQNGPAATSSLGLGEDEADGASSLKTALNCRDSTRKVDVLPAEGSRFTQSHTCRNQERPKGMPSGALRDGKQLLDLISRQRAQLLTHDTRGGHICGWVARNDSLFDRLIEGVVEYGVTVAYRSGR